MGGEGETNDDSMREHRNYCMGIKNLVLEPMKCLGGAGKLLATQPNRVMKVEGEDRLPQSCSPTSTHVL